MRLLFPLFLIFITATEADLIGKYQIDDEIMLDVLELKKDHTFEYISQDSIFPSQTITGNWSVRENLLILHHKTSIKERSAEYKEEVFQDSNDKVLIKVINENGEPEKGFEIKYFLNNQQSQVEKTNQDGLLQFNKYDMIKNENDLVQVEIVYFMYNSIVREKTTVNKNSDQIVLTIYSYPRVVERTLEYQFFIEEEKLISINAPFVSESRVYHKL